MAADADVSGEGCSGTFVSGSGVVAQPPSIQPRRQMRLHLTARLAINPGRVKFFGGFPIDRRMCLLGLLIECSSEAV